jgi:hypothetical protein
MMPQRRPSGDGRLTGVPAECTLRAVSRSLTATTTTTTTRSGGRVFVCAVS